MSSRITRNTKDFQGGADNILQNQLQLYKTPATVRELIVAPFFVEIFSKRRPLFSRLTDTNEVIEASTTNKHYVHFAEPALMEFPFGYQNNTPETTSTPQQYPPMGGVLSDNTKRLINKQKTVYPYLNNVQSDNLVDPKGFALGNLVTGQFPEASDNPPIGDASTAIYPGTQFTVNGSPNPEGKFMPVVARYNPPEPFPAHATWYQGQYKGPDLNFTTTTNVKTQLIRSSLTEIYDLIGTDVEVDLQEQFNKLNNIQASADKIVWELTLESVQVDSDGRTLASARLVNNGNEKMTQYLSDPLNPAEKDQWSVTDPINKANYEEALYGNTGFGYPITFQPRPIITQPISIGFPELACNASEGPQFVANSNEGYSLDKGAGSILKFGRFPWSKLKMNFGHYLGSPIGDPLAIENEVKDSRKFYDLNNEWFADTKNGGPTQPVFFNQQINKMVVRFSIKMIVLF